MSARMPARCVIVGAGAIAGAHAAALAEQGGRAQVVAAVDLDPDRARRFAHRWGIPRTATDLKEVLAGGEVDLVHICTPPHTHPRLAQQCLTAGVPVLLEKPPAISLRDLDTMGDTPHASIAVVFQHRFGSAADRVRRLATAGTLGRPLTATCQTSWYRDDVYFAAPWRGTWDNEGGGPTMGHGIHQMDLMLSILGPWAQVTAMAARQSRPTQTEDLSCAVVRFENGALATVVNSVVSPRQTSVLRIDWEHATTEVEHLYGYGDDDWRFTPAPGHEQLHADWSSGPAGTPSGHAAQLRVVLDALADGTPPPVTLAEARDTLELAAAIYASSFTARPVRRGEIGPGHPFYTRMDGTGAPWHATTSPRNP